MRSLNTLKRWKKICMPIKKGGSGIKNFGSGITGKMVKEVFKGEQYNMEKVMVDLSLTEIAGSREKVVNRFGWFYRHSLLKAGQC